MHTKTSFYDRISRKGAMVAVVVLTLIFSAVAILTYRGRIPSQGIVKSIGVETYWDASGTDPVGLINWGLLEPGTNKTVTFYIMNNGTASCTLSLEKENWNPQNVSSHVLLTWNYTGGILELGSVLPVELSLAVSSEVKGITNFTFDIVIVATEAE